jgi:hypothetical protein
VEQTGQRATAGKQASEGLGGRPTGADLPGRRYEVPRIQTLVLEHVSEERLALAALDRDWSQAAVTIPGKDLVKAPLAEAAVVSS